MFSKESLQIFVFEFKYFLRFLEMKIGFSSPGLPSLFTIILRWYEHLFTLHEHWYTSQWISFHTLRLSSKTNMLKHFFIEKIGANLIWVALVVVLEKIISYDPNYPRGKTLDYFNCECSLNNKNVSNLVQTLQGRDQKMIASFA